MGKYMYSIYKFKVSDLKRLLLIKNLAASWSVHISHTSILISNKKKHQNIKIFKKLYLLNSQ